MTRTDTQGIFCRIKTLFSLEDGMTLIELLTSMIVFLVVSTGIAGAMIVGLRSTSDAQLATMGKDVAQQQIEEIEAKPYFIPYSDDQATGTTADVDFLDVYYPDAMLGTVVDDEGREGWFTETSGDAYFTLVTPADERGIVTTVETRFVDDQGNVISPPATYDSNSYTVDYPPSQLVEITVTTSWQARNGEDSFTLVTRKSASGQTVGGGDLGEDPEDEPDDTGDGESEEDGCDMESYDAESDAPEDDSDDDGSSGGGYEPDPDDVSGDDEECDTISNDGESDDSEDTDSDDDESGDGGHGHH